VVPVRALVDTNVLVYLYDTSSPGKRQSAEAIVD
jgi:predicted nucleic acid-binding protein